MKIYHIALVAALGLLSIASGVPKVLGSPHEADFFRSVGLGPAIMTALGVAQITGGALLLSARVRFIGVVLVGVCFLLSAIMVLAAGNPGLAAVSTIPLIIAVYLGARERRSQDSGA